MEKETKLWKKMIFPLICLIVVLVFIFSMNDINDIYDTLKNADGINILYAVGMLLLYFILWPLSLYTFTKLGKIKIKFIDVFLIGSTEHFFNGVTPFASGGQPFQAYAFKRKDVGYSESTGILLINYIIYQAVITVMFLIAFILNVDYLKSNVSNVYGIMILGLVINILVLIIFIGIGCSKFVRNLFLKFIKLLAKIKFLTKHLEKRMLKIESYFNDYQEAFKYMSKNKLALLISTAIKVITMLVYYAIPFFVLRAVRVNVTYNDMFFIIAMTCFSICMTCWIPTPGASGGIEFAFKTLFASIVGVTSTVAVSGMLVWRFITYYLLMFISLIAFIIFEALCKKNNKTNDTENIEHVKENE